MQKFYTLLLNTLIATVTTSFLWFALTFWAYLETQSVIVTSIIGGSFMAFASVSSLFFGNYVDHHKKKEAMLTSSAITFGMYLLAVMLFVLLPQPQLLNLSHPAFWLLVVIILCGTIAGNMRSIALSTLVTIMVDKNKRDKANGLVGAVNGIAFALTSVSSGLVIGFLGMSWALGISVVMTGITMLHLYMISIEEKEPRHTQVKPKKMDISGTIRAIKNVPGLVGLIVFTTFNNLLGGAFISLMDAYGLSLVSVEVWGTIWGFLSIGFIIGGLVIAKKGLSKKPLRTLMLVNIALWIISIGFTIRASIVLTTVGIFLYMCLVPVVEAVEQTIIQRLVPLTRQGRVFGFAHSVESAASPMMAFLIGPITQFFFIPFMKTESGMAIFRPLLGDGPGRGIALVFVTIGVIGLIATILAMRSRAYHVLSDAYTRSKA